jgi:CBS domain-containing protein
MLSETAASRIPLRARQPDRVGGVILEGANFQRPEGGTLVNISAVLESKGSTVATIRPEASVSDLLAELARHRIGAVVVSTDGQHIQGIASERDVVRRLHELGPDILQQDVASIMTRDVRTCSPTEQVESLMVTMTRHRVRHVPVVADGVLAGIVSIGDVVKSRIDELEGDRDSLIDYITTGR